MTFALNSVKHSVAHRPKIGEEVRTHGTTKEPRRLGPPDSMIPLRPGGTTAQMRADCSVVDKRINGYYAVGRTIQGKFGCVQKTLRSWWKRKVALPQETVGDDVKHIYREHNP